MENMMDMLRILSDDKSNSIYLREIALLMEENDSLRETIRLLKKELKLRDNEIEILCGGNSE